METKAAQAIADALAADIKPLLAGHGPDIQGAVLCELLGLFIAGHHPAFRAEVMHMTVTTALKLAEISDQFLYGPKGFPTSTHDIN